MHFVPVTFLSLLFLLVPTITSAVEEKQIVPTFISSGEELVSPYKELLTTKTMGHIVYTVLRGLNRSTIAPLLMNLITLDPSEHNESAAIEFCESQVKQFLNGSMNKQSPEGCEYIVDCSDYEPSRFPAILIKGMCGNSYCGHPKVTGVIKHCNNHRERLPVLRYIITSTPYLRYNNGDTSTLRGMWVKDRVSINTDCKCL